MLSSNDSVVAFLQCSTPGLPQLTSPIATIDPHAIASRTIVKTFRLQILACARNIQRHEANRGINFALIYQAILSCTFYDLKILEIGAGPGAVACGFQQLGAAVSAIDLQDGRIFTHPDIQFEQDDARQLQFEPDQFDTASLTSVLHHIPIKDTIPVLREAIRVVRPGGNLFIQEDILATNPIHAWLVGLVDNLVCGEIHSHHARSHRTISEWLKIFQSLSLAVVGTRIYKPSWLGIGVQKAFFVVKVP